MQAENKKQATAAGFYDLAQGSSPCNDASAKQGNRHIDLLLARKLGVKEAAQVLGIGITTMRRVINAGEIPVIRIQGKILIMDSDLQGFLASHYGRLKISAHKSATSCLPPLPKEVRESPFLKRREN